MRTLSAETNDGTDHDTPEAARSDGPDGSTERQRQDSSGERGYLKKYNIMAVGFGSAFLLTVSLIFATAFFNTRFASNLFSFWPFSTTGQVFVESPEVYTRERLVNDRYQQEFWLRQQLENSDSSKNFISSRKLERIDGRINDSAGEGGEEPPYQPLPLNAMQVFELRSDLRDRLRQMLLENQLDDRHDLSGNSVYGLKFDTTVLPGANTRRRAYVRIRINTPELPSDNDLLGLFSSTYDEIRNGRSGFKQLDRYLVSWLASVEARLNSYLDDFDADADSCVTYDGDGLAAQPNMMSFLLSSFQENQEPLEVMREALSKVLSISPSEVEFPTNYIDTGILRSGVVKLPKPWRNYFDVRLVQDRSCGSRLRFEVARSTNLIWLVSAKSWTDAGLDYAAQIDLSRGEMISSDNRNVTQDRNRTRTIYFPISTLAVDDLVDPDSTGQGVEGNTRFYHVLVPRSPGADSEPGLPPTGSELESIQLKVNFSSEHARLLLKNEASIKQCVFPVGADAKDCKVMGRVFNLDASLYNFASAIVNSDFYLYAVFPKGDGSAISEQIDSNSTAKYGESGFGLVLKETKNRIIPEQVSFSGRETKNEIEFGWIISTEGQQVVSQKSAFVLLSLPAYLSRLSATVETGWLDRNSRFPKDSDAVDRKSISIVLPPDYEAFDSLVGSSVRYGPAIFYNHMKKVTVYSCTKATILIPGSRLWRSATVTLDGYPARKIVVMPNMRGIAATFDPVPIPASPSTSGLPSSASLQVWTSEGMDRIDKVISISNETADGHVRKFCATDYIPDANVVPADSSTPGQELMPDDSIE